MTSFRRTVIVLFLIALSAAAFAMLMWPVLANNGDYGMQSGSSNKEYSVHTAVASIEATSVPATAVPTNPPTAVPTNPPTAVPTNPPTAVPTNPPTAAPTVQGPLDTPAPNEEPTASPPD